MPLCQVSCLMSCVSDLMSCVPYLMSQGSLYSDISIFSISFSGSSERSAPLISLSSGMLDQLPWEPLTFTELERVAYDYSLENKSQWPYNFTYGERLVIIWKRMCLR